MRHLRSILYALVLAPAIWVLAGVGFTHDLSSRGRELFAAESISGLLLLLFSGTLFAILTLTPVSPAGPVLAGVVYLSVTIWAFNAPAAYAGLWAPEVSKEGFDLSRPGYGLAGLLAIPLLTTALSARRWARYEPPVLPIIGEIGRFRGKARVDGIPMSIAETTVLRAGRPITADPAASSDRTVAMPVAGDGSDRTVAINVDQTVAISTLSNESDRTQVLRTPAETAAAQPTTTEPNTAEPNTAEPNTAEPNTAEPNTAEPATAATLAPAGATAAGATAAGATAAGATAAGATAAGSDAAGSDAGRAWDQSIALQTPAAEPTTVYVVSSDETTSVTVRPAPTHESGITDNPVTAKKAGPKPGDDETERLPRPSDADATQAIPAPVTQAPKNGTVTPPSDLAVPVKLPPAGDATALIPAQRRPPAIES